MRTALLILLASSSVLAQPATPQTQESPKRVANKSRTPREWVDELVRASRVYDERAMARASSALAVQGAPAVSALIETLDDEDDNVRWQALVALGRIGRPAARLGIPKAKRALADVDADVRGAAAIALLEFHATSDDVRKELEQARSDEHGKVRADAHKALFGLHGDRRSIEALDALLSHKDWLVASAAAKHLAAMARDADGEVHETIIARLSTRLRDRSARGRPWAAHALALVGTRASAAVSALIATLSENVPALATESARALGAIGERAVIPLIALTEIGAVDVQIGAFRALGLIGAPARPAAGAILSIVRASDAPRTPNLRVAAATALGAMQTTDSEALDWLAQCLRHPSEDVRGAAAQALGRVGAGARRHLATLREVAKNDSADFVRGAAAWAVSELEQERE